MRSNQAKQSLINKSLCVLMVLVLACAIPVARPEEADAATGLSLAELKEKFPQGEYWNHNPNGANLPDKTTKNPCTHHSKVKGKSNCNVATGSCGCNSFGGAIQCMGFAEKLGFDAYRTMPKSWSETSDRKAVDSLKPGDVVRYEYDGHSIFVTGVSGETVTFAECWGRETCYINWNGKTTKSAIKSSLTYVRSAPWALDGGSAPEPNYVDLGTNVYFNIIQADGWKYVTNDGGNVVMAEGTDNLATRQLWRMYRQTDGSYRVQNEYDGLFLEAANNGSTRYTNIAVNAMKGTANQQWKIYRNGTDYSLRASHCAMNLDAFTGAGAPNVGLYDPAQNVASQVFVMWNTGNHGLDYRKAAPEAPQVQAQESSLGCVSLSWNECSSSSTYDSRTYEVYVYEGAIVAGTPVFSQVGITDTNIDLELGEGDYTAVVRARNNMYKDLSSTSQAVQFNVSDHVHDAVPSVGIAPTCTAAGVEGGTHCSVCQRTLVVGAAIPALGHSFIGGMCERCGASSVEPVLPAFGSADNIGEDFYAYVIKASDWRFVTNDNENAIMADGSEDLGTKQVWHFQRCASGAYKITNEWDGSVLEVEGASAERWANVELGQDKSIASQRWYVYRHGANYSLKAAYCDLDFTAFGGTGAPNAGLLTATSENEDQVFIIWNLAEHDQPYSKEAPSKPSVSISRLANGMTAVSWTESESASRYDDRTYEISVYAGASEERELIYGATGLVDTSVELGLPAGRYIAVVRARNNRYVDFCTDSDEFSFEVSGAHVHTVVAGQEVAATCRQSGKTAGSYCSECGEVVAEGEIVTALGHSFVEGACMRCSDELSFTYFGAGLTLLRYSPAVPISTGCPTYFGQEMIWIPEVGSLEKGVWAILLADVNQNDLTYAFDVNEGATVQRVSRPNAEFDGILAGDVNMNGVLNIVDAQITYDASIGKYDPSALSAFAWLLADVSDDGVLDAVDAFAVQHATQYGWMVA